MNSLERALEEQKQSTQQEILRFTGLLGIALGGSRVVEVPTRKGFVYVRLRDNPNEVIQAFNNQVASSYNLPVIVERQGNKYVISGVDTTRYENNHNSYAPYLPRHGNTHSFDLESGGGGDIVWVYPRQFVPALVFPSGSLGSPNVFVSPYTLKRDNGTWVYTGGTGTPNIAPYRPSSPTGAIMGLVYLDADDGNPYLLIGSGTVFPNSITGSSQIIPYIPQVSNVAKQIPIAAIRLVTGTNTISWDNIYDVRQFIHGQPTGTGGGGGSISTGTLDARYLKLDASNDPITGALSIITSQAKSPLGFPFDHHALNIVNNDPSDTDGGLMVNSTSGSYGAYIAVINNGVLYLDQFYRGNQEETEPVAWITRFGESDSNRVFSPALVIDDITNSNASFYGGTILHRISGSATMFQANPQATGTLIPYIFNTQYPKPTGAILSSWRVQGLEMAYLDVSGTFHSNGSPLIKEAPVGGQPYVRKSAGWDSPFNDSEGTGIPSPIGSSANGTSTYAARRDHVHAVGTTTPIYIPFGVNIHVNPMSASPSFPYATSVDDNRTLTFVRWSQAWHVGTTNNGSNFWTIAVKRLSDSATIASFNTSAGAASTWTLNVSTTFSIASIAAAGKGVFLECTKTGAPGNLSLYGPILEVTA